MVMLGAYVQKSGILDADGVKHALPHFVKARHLIPLNEKAIDAGAEFIRSKK
jgi:Pyruvate/2-oxoacid:ferredoxin oxidoreductase gamma subunit